MSIRSMTIKTTLLLMSFVSLLVSCDDGSQNVNSALKSLTPKGVTATSGNSQVGLSWLLVTGASSYNIYYSNTTGVTPGNGTLVTDVVTAPLYLHQNLTNGKTYYYVVASVDASGNESPPSVEVSTTPLAISPDLTQVPWGTGGSAGGGGMGAGGVSGQGGNSVSSLTVTVSPANGATGVSIQTPLVLTFSRPINPQTITPTNIQVTNQQGTSLIMTPSSSDNMIILLTSQGPWKAGQIHTVSIRNVMDTLGNVISPLFSTFTTAPAPSGAGGGGMTPGSPGGTTGGGGTGGIPVISIPNGGAGGGGTGASGAPLPAPTGVTATGGTFQITISWTAVPNAVSYNLYYAKGVDCPVSVTSPTTGKTSGITSTSYIFQLFMRARPYCFAVTAVDSSGQEGPLSSQNPLVSAVAY